MRQNSRRGETGDVWWGARVKERCRLRNNGESETAGGGRRGGDGGREAAYWSIRPVGSQTVRETSVLVLPLSGLQTPHLPCCRWGGGVRLGGKCAFVRLLARFYVIFSHGLPVCVCVCGCVKVALPQQSAWRCPLSSRGLRCGVSSPPWN